MIRTVIGWLSVVVDARRWLCSIEDDADHDKNGILNSAPTDERESFHEAYAPFARNDSYGVAGWHGPPLTIRQYLRILRRTVCLSITVVTFFGCVTISEVVLGETGACELLSNILPWYCGVCMRSLGFGPLEVVGETADPNAAVLVCNHVSYLDMLVLCVQFFPSFVAKASIQHLPIWGRVAKLLRCTFVAHGESSTSDLAPGTTKTSAVDEIVANIRAVAEANAEMDTTNEPPRKRRRPPILIFPEGTTTNGSYLLPFRKGAFIAGVPVQPLLLHYSCGGGRFNPSWESIGITTHLRLLLAQPGPHRCRMTILPPMSPPSTKDPTLYATHVRDIMAKEGNLTLSDLVYQDKKKYHTLLIDQGYS